VIDCVLAPVDQRLPVAAEEVRVIVLPAQNELGPLMVGVVGAAFAVTTKGADVEGQPPAVTTTVYEPAVDTMIDRVVSPVDQRFPVAAEEVRVIVVPGQNEDGPLIVGVAGGALTVTLVVALELTQLPTETLTL
jgi:hypothetical protein